MKEDEVEEEEEEEEVKEEEVMSEVHVGCPPNFSGPYVSHFTFPFPFSTGKHNRAEYTDQLHVEVTTSPNVCLDKEVGRQIDQQKDELSSSPKLSLDDDGDLALNRRNRTLWKHNRAEYTDQLHVGVTTCPSVCLDKKERYPTYALAIQHSITSSLPDVGLQVWMAALVLTDFVLHKSSTSSEFDGITALELGSGTGLVGIALALVARTVYITDRGTEILDNCATNASLNSSLLNYHKASVRVRELDWTEQWPPRAQTNHTQNEGYSWISSEIEEAEGASVLLAADVIYSDELTDSFFVILERLMSRGSKKMLYLALEKRYNFSMNDLDVVANGYAHFRSFLKNKEECGTDDRQLSCFKGEQIDLTLIPQYIREYERGMDVEIWKITYCSNKR